MKLRAIVKKLKGLIKPASKQLINKKDELIDFISINNTNEKDIFIAGYPKSGNTWMQNLICGLLFGIETSLLPDKLTQELVPDVHAKKFYKRFGTINFFKTHDLPKKNMRRVIHLVRDGRDVMASYYAMNIAMGKKMTLNDMIVDGKDMYPVSWHEHCRQWLNNPFNADILIVKYEDLLTDTFNQLKRIVAFSGITRSDDIINRAILGNSFDEMKRKEKEYGWDNKSWNPEKDFIRKGKMGSYVNEIPEDLVEIFESKSKAELKYFNYLK